MKLETFSNKPWLDIVILSSTSEKKKLEPAAAFLLGVNAFVKLNDGMNELRIRNAFKSQSHSQQSTGNLKIQQSTSAL